MDQSSNFEWEDNPELLDYEEGNEEEEEKPKEFLMNEMYKEIYEKEDMKTQGKYDGEQQAKKFGTPLNVETQIKESFLEMDRRAKVFEEAKKNPEDFLSNISEEEKNLSKSMVLKHPEQEFALIQIASQEVPPCSPIPHFRIVGVCKGDPESISTAISNFYKKDTSQMPVTLAPYRMHMFGIIPRNRQNFQNDEYQLAKCVLLDKNYINAYEARKKMAENNIQVTNDEIPKVKPHKKRNKKKNKKPIHSSTGIVKPSLFPPNSTVPSTTTTMTQAPTLPSNLNQNTKKHSYVESKMKGTWEIAEQAKQKYKFAVIILIKDEYREKGLSPEPMLKILQCFETEKEAKVYSKCVAANPFRAYHLDVVEMYQWGSIEQFENSESIEVIYRNREYQLMMDRLKVSKNEASSYSEYQKTLNEQEKKKQEQQIFDQIKQNY